MTVSFFLDIMLCVSISISLLVLVTTMFMTSPLEFTIFPSLLLVTMDRGAGEISTAFSLNQSFADILTGIILFFIIATEFFITYKVTLRKSSKKEA